MDTAGTAPVTPEATATAAAAGAATAAAARAELPSPDGLKHQKDAKASH